MEVKQAECFNQNQILNMLKEFNKGQEARELKETKVEKHISLNRKEFDDIFNKEVKKKITPEDEEDEDKQQMIACNCCTIILLIIGIIYLIKDYELCKKCGGSSLWAYVLTTLIISACCGGNDYKKYKSQKSVLVILTFILLTNTSMCIWGGIELWGKSCESLTGSSIWIFGCILFVFQLITSIICWKYISYLICFAETEDDHSSTKNDKGLTNVV